MISFLISPPLLLLETTGIGFILGKFNQRSVSFWGGRGLLEKCDLRVSKSGEYRTIYSLRHTYATQRINEVSVYQLSVNMGTSVKMIEEFYSHAKVKDPEFAKSITKGNQKGSSEIPSFLK